MASGCSAGGGILVFTAVLVFTGAVTRLFSTSIWNTFTGCWDPFGWDLALGPDLGRVSSANCASPWDSFSAHRNHKEQSRSSTKIHGLPGQCTHGNIQNWRKIHGNIITGERSMVTFITGGINEESNQTKTTYKSRQHFEINSK